MATNISSVDSGASATLPPAQPTVSCSLDEEGGLVVRFQNLSSSFHTAGEQERFSQQAFDSVVKLIGREAATELLPEIREAINDAWKPETDGTPRAEYELYVASPTPTPFFPASGQSAADAPPATQPRPSVPTAPGVSRRTPRLGQLERERQREALRIALETKYMGHTCTVEEAMAAQVFLTSCGFRPSNTFKRINGKLTPDGVLGHGFEQALERLLSKLTPTAKLADVQAFVEAKRGTFIDFVKQRLEPAAKGTVKNNV